MFSLSDLNCVNCSVKRELFKVEYLILCSSASISKYSLGSFQLVDQ